MIRFFAIGTVFLGCLPVEGPSLLDVRWERTSVGTVVEVSWEVDEAATTWVEFGPAPQCDEWQTSKSLGKQGQALLLGLPPVTDSCFVVHAEAGGVQVTSPMESFRTENVPASFEAMDIESWDPTGYQDGFFVGSNALNPAQVYVLDRQGRFVWWKEVGEDFVSPQMVLSPDGRGFSYNTFFRDFSVDASAVTRVGFDGEEEESIPTPNGHHSFSWLPDGSLAYLAIDVRTTQEYGDVVGDVLMVDDGNGPRELWNSWEDSNLLLEKHRLWKSTFYPQGIDWTHANYLSYSAQRNSFTISFANIEAIIEVDADTGAHLRSIGPTGTHMVEPGLLGRPHAAAWTEQGTLMFFTTPLWGLGRQSMGMELSFDDESATTEVVWSYGEGLNYDTHIMGEALPLESGNVLMNYGSKGIVEEVNLEGEVLWRAYTATGSVPGHWNFLEGFYEEGAP